MPLLFKLIIFRKPPLIGTEAFNVLRKGVFKVSREREGGREGEREREVGGGGRGERSREREGERGKGRER